MGTRNLIEVVKGGQLKVAQYGQWDGYPTGQGAGIARFLHEEMDKEKFLKALDNVSFSTEKDDIARIKDMKKTFPDMNEDGWLNMEEAEWYTQNYPELSRDTGSDVLKIIQEKDGNLKLHNESDFKDDKVFCEFWYLIDMDKETVTVNNKVTLPFSEWTVERMQSLEDEKNL